LTVGEAFFYGSPCVGPKHSWGTFCFCTSSLSNDLRDPELSIVSFGGLLKTHLFQQYLVYQAN